MIETLALIATETESAKSLISTITKFLGIGSKQVRFSDSDKLGMWNDIVNNTINPYLKNNFGIDLNNTERKNIDAMLDAWCMVRDGKIDNYTFHRPEKERGSAINDAVKIVPRYDRILDPLKLCWFWLTWDIWKQDTSELIYNQRVIPLFKMVDNFVERAGLKQITKTGDATSPNKTTIFNAPKSGENIQPVTSSLNAGGVLPQGSGLSSLASSQNIMIIGAVIVIIILAIIFLRK